MYKREVVLGIMQSWVGRKEADGSHKPIVDIYNTIKPLPRGYKVKYTDAWCATTISAAFHQAGYDDIFPHECGCEKMIAKAQKMGIWQENDAHIPSPGDGIMYDWQDDGVGDCIGAADHVGMVEKVENGIIHVIDGNYSDSVKRHQLPVNGKNIRGFVLPKFDDAEEKKPTATSPTSTATPETNDSIIWKYFKSKGLSDEAVAGIEGNLKAESGLEPKNLQNSFNKKLNITDEEYTELVDNNAYPNFTKDSAGYGLAQWTFWSRKQNLLNFAKAQKKSIGDLGMQLDFLWQELQGYKAVFEGLKNAKSVREASDIILTQFERPADQSVKVQEKRASFGQEYYDKFAGKVAVTTATASKPVAAAYVPGTYKTVAGPMRLRTGAGINYPQKKFEEMTTSAKSNNAKYRYTGMAYYGVGVTFSALAVEKASDGSWWGKTPSGWICLEDSTKKYCQKA